MTIRTNKYVLLGNVYLFEKGHEKCTGEVEMDLALPKVCNFIVDRLVEPPHEGVFLTVRNFWRAVFTGDHL